MTDIDELISESQNTRLDLLRMASKLEAFSAALIVEAGRLRNEVRASNAGDNENEATQAKSIGGSPESEHKDS